MSVKQQKQQQQWRRAQQRGSVRDDDSKRKRRKSSKQPTNVGRPDETGRMRWVAENRKYPERIDQVINWLPGMMITWNPIETTPHGGPRKNVSRRTSVSIRPKASKAEKEKTSDTRKDYIQHPQSEERTSRKQAVFGGESFRERQGQRVVSHLPLRSRFDRTKAPKVPHPPPLIVIPTMYTLLLGKGSKRSRQVANQQKIKYRSSSVFRLYYLVVVYQSYSLLGTV